jgi:hypothetical protein
MAGIRVISRRRILRDRESPQDLALKHVYGSDENLRTSGPGAGAGVSVGE